MTPPAAPRHRGAPASPPASWPWATATAIYFVSICLLHLKFSLWLVRPRELPWGRHAFAELVPAAVGISALLLAWVVAGHVRRSARPRMLAGAWMLWALAVLAIDRWLTYSVNEYFHYPQYALLAWLIARMLDPERDRVVPGRVLFRTTLLGGIDELLQYLWVTASYSHYFDVNDVLVNLVAAVAGVLLYYAPAQKRLPTREKRRALAWLEANVGIILGLAAAVALASGKLQASPMGAIAPGGIAKDARGRPTLYLQRNPSLHGSWQPGLHRGRHYVLHPLEGIFLLAVTGTAFSIIVGRLRRSGGDGEIR